MPISNKATAMVSALALAWAAAPAAAQAPTSQPWSDRALSPDRRAELVVQAMTQDEKLSILTGYFGVDQAWNSFKADPLARRQSAGFVPGVPRLGLTPQWQTDAGSGVATQGQAPPELERTALPAGILTASTWNPALAERGGRMIGSEARASGFNVMLAGGVNLLREPRNGRNFEYGGEDPLLAGVMTGAVIRGIQSNGIVSTVKHYAFNNQETGRSILDAVIEEGAARTSDLMAFQIAVEQGQPGSVMCAYNKVNGPWSCENDWLLNQVLKRDWQWPGFVMSDWGATHSTVDAANHGLDQETGVNRKGEYHFLDKLKAAVAEGKVPQSRVDDMARRILRALFASGSLDNPPAPGPIDFAAHEAVAQADAEEGIVLLKNSGGLLPLKAGAKVAVIGGHADKGVLSGGGSAQVYARGGNAVPGLEPKTWPGPVVYYKSAPLAAITARAGAKVEFASGDDVAEAQRIAKAADVAVVFVNQWTAESQDYSISLDAQDRLVAAVAAANPRTVVVLQTGGPVLMPWIDRVRGVIEAWYPGSRGGEALGRVLYGEVNPSGRLPATFPASLDQLPRPKLDGQGLARNTAFTVRYDEGATVGYKWFDAKGLKPLFPFGHGLSYTSFRHDGLAAAVDGGELKVRFRITNTGRTAGKEVAQVYVAPVSGGWEAPKRLGGFQKLELKAGETKAGEVTVDPRLLAVWDAGAHGWRIAPGDYRVTLAASAADPGQSVVVRLPERRLPVGPLAARP